MAETIKLSEFNNQSALINPSETFAIAVTAKQGQAGYNNVKIPVNSFLDLVPNASTSAPGLSKFATSQEVGNLATGVIASPADVKDIVDANIPSGVLTEQQLQEELEDYRKKSDTGVINVLDIGFHNDGVTDNTQVMNDFLEARRSKTIAGKGPSRVTLYFPRGTYLFEDLVDSPWPHYSRIVGDGRDQTIFYAKKSLFKIWFRISQNGPLFEHLTFRGDWQKGESWDPRDTPVHRYHAIINGMHRQDIGNYNARYGMTATDISINAPYRVYLNDIQFSNFEGSFIYVPGLMWEWQFNRVGFGLCGRYPIEAQKITINCGFHYCTWTGSNWNRANVLAGFGQWQFNNCNWFLSSSDRYKLGGPRVQITPNGRNEAARWVSNAGYTFGQGIWIPEDQEDDNDNRVKTVFMVVNNLYGTGNTGATEPDWDLAPNFGDKIVDNGVTWMNVDIAVKPVGYTRNWIQTEKTNFEHTVGPLFIGPQIYFNLRDSTTYLQGAAISPNRGMYGEDKNDHEGGTRTGDFTTRLDQSVPRWPSNTPVKEGMRVATTTANFDDKVPWVCVALNDGTTGNAEPDWPEEFGDTVVDNDIVWMRWWPLGALTFTWSPRSSYMQRLNFWEGQIGGDTNPGALWKNCYFHDLRKTRLMYADGKGNSTFTYNHRDNEKKPTTQNINTMPTADFSPVDNETGFKPTVIGELYFNTSDNTLWLAKGSSTKADWIQVANEDNFSQVKEAAEFSKITNPGATLTLDVSKAFTYVETSQNITTLNITNTKNLKAGKIELVVKNTHNSNTITVNMDSVNGGNLAQGESFTVAPNEIESIEVVILSDVI